VSDQPRTWTAISPKENDRDAVSFQNLCVSSGEETSLFSLPEIQLRFVGILVRRLVSVLTEPSSSYDDSVNLTKSVPERRRIKFRRRRHQRKNTIIILSFYE
jgi:hypothetical protein